MEGTPPRITRSDWLVPAALAAIGVAEVFTVDGLPRVAGVVSVLVPCALLVGRRRWPLVMATAATIAVSQGVRIGVPDDALTTMLVIIFAGCFALGRHVDTWWKGAAAVALIDLTVHWTDGFTAPPLADVLWVGALSYLPWFFGRLVHAHARQNEQLADRARRLVDEQREVTARAVAEERRRIARELHDVIAHSVSVMVVQAGAARDLVGSDPDGVARSLDAIQASGRSALGETGRLLGLLREEEDDGVAPQPSASDIPRLVETFRESGLDVELDLAGSTDGLAPGLDLSLFRIVEEGLTNALKHTPGAHVRVSCRRTADRIEIDLASSGDGSPPSLPSGGHGLVGMQERVAVFGGSFSAGPTGDGFLVRARLPVGDPA